MANVEAGVMRDHPRESGATAGSIDPTDGAATRMRGIVTGKGKATEMRGVGGITKAGLVTESSLENPRRRRARLELE